MTTPGQIRVHAEDAAANLPPLMARAMRLAGAVLPGEHGRRRAGQGDDFWQFRPMRPGDSRRMIDWRRSARADLQFVREREWQIAQNIQLWIDQAASMRFSSNANLPEKTDRARLLGLSLAILLVRGGERVGLADGSLAPARGQLQLQRLAAAFCAESAEDYSVPAATALVPYAHAAFFSDFLGDFDQISTALTSAADRGVRGFVVQILDPAEESYPFRGRTIFESPGRTLRHETLKADDLRSRYLDRLRERKAKLQGVCRLTGWRYLCHHTSDSAQTALLWLYRAFDEAPS